MIDIKEKKNCCGCGGCMNVCPKHCITMKADNEGFLYPEIDKDACVNCGLCEKVCPVVNCKPDIPFEQTAYLVQNKDEVVRRESTSGGAFTTISEYVIKQGGVIFGAAYDDKFRVHHMYVEEKTELWRFRNSKYVQSDTEVTFSEVEKFLKEGRMVCYSGTPCQIEGLKRYLRRKYENLITVDIVCHAVPSPLVWNKYVEMQQEQFGTGISNIIFRDKHYGYKYSTMTIKDKDGKEVYTYGIDTDPMLRAFFSNICDRPSCYDCKFKKRYRVSDFTLWDCYEVDKFDKNLDDDKGTTRVLVHSEKGREMLKKIESDITFAEVNPDDLTAQVKEMFYSVSNNEKRQQFFIDVNTIESKELFKKWFPETAKVRIERTARIFCYKTGIYNIAKKVAKKVIGKR
ncbi:MAG: Coenzyme F420 hydrogenase/dehydrogenase, beta subunit C-terminal domain [Lachnospiraceae bacterium]|nr:Coenzyme F420 hydrogenase/dehydrogenase, beta subunit C-terminal domain [Lachnospiraceae bacterium]